MEPAEVGHPATAPPPPRDWGTTPPALAPGAELEERTIGPYLVGSARSGSATASARPRTRSSREWGCACWAPFDHNGLGAQTATTTATWAPIINRTGLLDARAPDFEDVRFHGFGNDTEDGGRPGAGSACGPAQLLGARPSGTGWRRAR